MKYMIDKNVEIQSLVDWFESRNSFIDQLETELQQKSLFDFDGLKEILEDKIEYNTYFQQLRINNKKIYLIVKETNERLMVIQKKDSYKNKSVQNKDDLKEQYSIKDYLFQEYDVYDIPSHLQLDPELPSISDNQEPNQIQQSNSISSESYKHNPDEQTYQCNLVKKLKIIYSIYESFYFIPTHISFDNPVSSQVYSVRQNLHLIQRICKISGENCFGIDLQNMKELQSLNLDFDGLTIEDKISSKLDSLIKQLPNISEFKLSNHFSLSQTPSSSFSRLISSLNHLNKLIILKFDFTDCKNINSKVLSDIAHLISRQYKFQHFYINLQNNKRQYTEKHCIFSERHSFIYALRNCKDLKKLSINLMNKFQKSFFDIELKYLGETLFYCSQLEDLTLYFTKYNIESITHGFKNLQNLIKLELKIENSVVNKLIEQILILPNLKEIKLDFDESFYDSRQIIQNISKLQDIQLECFKKKMDKSKMILRFKDIFLFYFDTSQFYNEFKNIDNLSLRVYDEVCSLPEVIAFANMFKNLLILDFCFYQTSSLLNTNLIQFGQCRNLRYLQIQISYSDISFVSKKFSNLLYKNNKYLVFLEIKEAQDDQQTQ